MNEWIRFDMGKEIWGDVLMCQRCGYMNVEDRDSDDDDDTVSNLNFCPHCGYQYHEWDGMPLRDVEQWLEDEDEDDEDEDDE